MARDRRDSGASGRADRQVTVANEVSQEEALSQRKIFVGGLAHKTGKHHLREHFARFGTVVDAVVLRWSDGRSRGFGYVTFADCASIATVLEEAHQISGRQVEVKRAVPGTNKLFVGGLPQNATASELRAYFEAFGVVSDAVVMIDPATKRSRGFGFVCFLPGPEGAYAVDTALEQYQEHRIRGKWIELGDAGGRPTGETSYGPNLASPKKVHIGGHVAAWGREAFELKEVGPHAAFDASGDLQKSLEQLLRSQLGGATSKQASRNRASTSTSASEDMVSTTKTEV